MKHFFYLFFLTFIFGSCAIFEKKQKTFPPSNFIVIETKYGLIHLKLYDETPLHRDNFKQLVKDRFFDSLMFHRVIPNFMIQGGDPESKRAAAGVMLGNGDVGYQIPAEIKTGLFHKRGALAAARDNNPEKKSSGCQFYIVDGKKFTDAELDQLQKKLNRVFTPEERVAYTTIGGAPHLDGNYTVFGEVLSGMNVVDSIAKTKKDLNNRPINDIRMFVRFDAPKNP